MTTLSPHTQQLGQEKIGKLLWNFSLPAIIGMLVSAIYNIVDRIFVRRGVGTLALTGVALTFPINLMIMALSMLIGIGASALISIKLGQGKRQEAEEIVGNAFLAQIVISVIAMIMILLFAEPLLGLLGASAEAMPYALDFIRIIALGIPFMGIGFGMNGIIRAQGDPRMAMISQLMGAGLNIVLNPLFIFVFHWGVKGSAWATVISQAVVTIWVIAYFLGKRSELKLRKQYIRLRWTVLRGITAIGLSPFSFQIVNSGIIIVINRQLGLYGGDEAIAVYAALNAVISVFIMPLIGISQGTQPIVGFNYGAQQFDRVKQAVKTAMLAATAICAVGFILSEIFPHQLLALFGGENVEQQFMDMGVSGLRIMMAFSLFIGMQIIASNYFQATGRAAKAIFLSLTRQLIFLLPLLFAFPLFWGVNGIWLATPVSDALSFIVTMRFLFVDFRKLGRQDGLIVNKA